MGSASSSQTAPYRSATVLTGGSASDSGETIYQFRQGLPLPVRSPRHLSATGHRTGGYVIPSTLADDQILWCAPMQP